MKKQIQKIFSIGIILSSVFVGYKTFATEISGTLGGAGIETGISIDTENCDPLTVSNGTVSDYPSCTITCNTGYKLDNEKCVRKSSGGSGGGGRTSSSSSSISATTTTTTTAQTTPTYYFTSNMRLGSTWGEVLVLQQFLASQGYYTDTLNNYFGLSTQLALIAYQKAHGLSGDGIVGPATRAVLNGIQTTPTAPITPTTPGTIYTYNFGTRLLKNGSMGDDVKELQRFLNKALGLGLKEDGILGPKTIAIIKQWQKSQGLKDDGVVGPQTKAKMLEVAKGFK